jgi:hypothetical protein
MDRMDMMAMRHMRMMPGFLMIASFVVLGCRAMVLSGLLMMLGGFLVMIRSVFRHEYLPP